MSDRTNGGRRAAAAGETPVTGEVKELMAERDRMRDAGREEMAAALAEAVLSRVARLETEAKLRRQLMKARRWLRERGDDGTPEEAELREKARTMVETLERLLEHMTTADEVGMPDELRTATEPEDEQPGEGDAE